MADLQKIVKLTQAQYDILASGGTVGDFTGLNDSYLYFIQDEHDYVTLDTIQTITGNKTFEGIVDITSGTAKLKTIQIPSASGGNTYTKGSNGKVIKSNGNTVY
jgi:hypothetical protein